MSTKRQKKSRHTAARITPAAVDAWRAGDHAALHAAMRLRPWQPSPLDVAAGPSPWPIGTMGAAHWLEAQQLRADLEAACHGN